MSACIEGRVASKFVALLSKDNLGRLSAEYVINYLKTEKKKRKRA